MGGDLRSPPGREKGGGGSSGKGRSNGGARTAGSGCSGKAVSTNNRFSALSNGELQDEESSGVHIRMESRLGEQHSAGNADRKRPVDQASWPPANCSGLVFARPALASAGLGNARLGHDVAPSERTGLQMGLDATDQGCGRKTQNEMSVVDDSGVVIPSSPFVSQPGTQGPSLISPSAIVEMEAVCTMSLAGHSCMEAAAVDPASIGEEDEMDCTQGVRPNATMQDSSCLHIDTARNCPGEMNIAWQKAHITAFGGESSNAMENVQEFIADHVSNLAIGAGQLPVSAGMNSNTPLVSNSRMEVDKLSIHEIAGHSAAMEAAVTGPDVAEMQDSRRCTPAVCANAAVSKSDQFGQNSGAALIRNKNAWLRPKYVAFEQIDEAIAAAKEAGPVKLDRIASLNSINKLEKGLVGKLLGRRLPFVFLKAELHRRWDQFGVFQVLTVSADCFICLFESKDARDAVLLGGPWLVGGQIIGMDRWTPSFTPQSLEGLKSPIWIRLPHLPLPYWDNWHLSRIAAKLGQPLGMDTPTSSWSRCAFARICVRMDLSVKLPTGIWLEGFEGEFFQPIEFEGISMLCFKCGIIGHKVESCKHNIELDQATLQATEATVSLNSTRPTTPGACLGDQGSAGRGGSDGGLASRGYGTWVLVENKRSKSKQKKASNSSTVQPMENNQTTRGPLSRQPHRRGAQDFVAVQLDSVGKPMPESHNGALYSALSPDAAPFVPLPQPLASSTSPPPPIEGSQAMCSPPIFTAMDTRLNRKSTSSKGRTSKDRVSKAHFLKELSQLGPIAMKSRKKRKNSFEALNGEGDSPSGS